MALRMPLVKWRGRRLPGEIKSNGASERQTLVWTKRFEALGRVTDRELSSSSTDRGDQFGELIERHTHAALHA